MIILLGHGSPAASAVTLMELIILNIGLQRGIITPLLFTVMVIMAVVTTLMASPIFAWVYQRPNGAKLPVNSLEAVA